MEPALAAVWLIRLAFLGLLYLFLAAVVRILVRDLRAAARATAVELGRLVVIEAPDGEPPPGTRLPLGAVTILGRDVNSSIVLDDPFVSGSHAVLSYRGRTWYVEDLGSTNGTYVNGLPIDGPTPMGFGDELQVGRVRLRLERGGS
ncbi:MAG TPA: FHA domain-containing protein [Candidatus Binatia bacterium]|nr:FHA domain-containing protein [Candidatus Binatia bacterium]